MHFPWNAFPKCTGKTKETLRTYRERVKQLKEGTNGVNTQELDFIGLVPPKRHGELQEVPIGYRLDSRAEAAVVGIHTNTSGDVDAVEGEACYAICLDGKCSNYKVLDDGTIIYSVALETGCRHKSGQKNKSHKIRNKDCKSLILSRCRRTPIRVLRKVWHTTGRECHFQYHGLHMCKSHKLDSCNNKHNFTLSPVNGKSEKSPSHTDSKVRAGKRKASDDIKINDGLQSRSTTKIKRSKPDPAKCRPGALGSGLASKKHRCPKHMFHEKLRDHLLREENAIQSQSLESSMTNLSKGRRKHVGMGNTTASTLESHMALRQEEMTVPVSVSPSNVASIKKKNAPFSPVFQLKNVMAHLENTDENHAKKPKNASHVSSKHKLVHPIPSLKTKDKSCNATVSRDMNVGETVKKEITQASKCMLNFCSDIIKKEESFFLSATSSQTTETKKAALPAIQMECQKHLKKTMSNLNDKIPRKQAFKKE